MARPLWRARLLYLHSSAEATEKCSVSCGIGTVKLIGGLGDSGLSFALCVGSGGKTCPRSRSGGGRGHPSDLGPDREAVGHHLSVVGRRQQVPTGPKVRRDAAARRQEPLCMPHRGEAFHRPLPGTDGLMGVLGPVEFRYFDRRCCTDGKSSRCADARTVNVLSTRVNVF